MPRKYLTLTENMPSLAIGDYLLHIDRIIEDEQTGAVELLLVTTYTRHEGPGRSNARYLAPGARVELGNQIGFHFFVGSQQRLRGVLDVPEGMQVRHVRLG